ncbi:MAG TPA: hypothetical protein VLU95_01520 [Candidatus Acidoferrum sp.]|nr:hypothetical protein [Candidatus Acidoferrum sp.]
MTEKFDRQHKIEELKDMIKNKKPGEPVEEVLTTYCQRHGISIETCRVYYDQLIKKGEIKEK